MVGPIIRGTYTLHSENHEKPVYRKDEKFGPKALDVMLYFWDDRESPEFSGWWFGPKVGGDQVWAFQTDCETLSPPTEGWKCPFDGPVDSTISICPRAVSSSAPANSVKGQQGKQAQGSPKKKEEAQLEELRRREQRALLSVRRVVQKLKLAKPETFEELAKELKTVLSTEEMHLGSQREKLQEEAEKALVHARERVQQLKHAEKTGEHVNAKLEEARQRLVELKGLAEVADSKLKQLQSVAESLLSSTTLPDPPAEAKAFELSAALDLANQAVQSSQKAFAESRASSKSTLDEAGMLRVEIKDQVSAVLSSMEVLGKQRAKCFAEAEVVRQQLHVACYHFRRAAKVKAGAKDFQERERQTFEKYDLDADEVLSLSEMQAYARGEFKTEVPQEDLHRLLRVLAHRKRDKAYLSPEPSKGLQLADFYHLKAAVGIARELARDKLREPKPRCEELQATKAEQLPSNGSQLEVERAVSLTAETEALLNQLLTESQQLLVTSMKGQSAAVLREQSDEVAFRLAAAEERAANCREVAEALGRVNGQEALHLELRRTESKKLLSRTSKFEEMLRPVRMRQAALRVRAEARARQEDQELHERVLDLLRNFPQDHVDPEQDQLHTFPAPSCLGAGDVVLREELLDFLRPLAKVAGLLESEVVRWCKDFLPGESMSKEALQRALAIRYMVVRQSLLTDALALQDGRTLRKLELDEVLLCGRGQLETDQGSGLQRIRGRAVKDGLTGWVTISSNEGSAYLRRGGSRFQVLKETPLTDTLAPAGALLRNLTNGEVVEILTYDSRAEAAVAGPPRLQVRALRDGSIGWADRASPTGVVYLKPL